MYAQQSFDEILTSPSHTPHQATPLHTLRLLQMDSKDDPKVVLSNISNILGILAKPYGAGASTFISHPMSPRIQYNILVTFFQTEIQQLQQSKRPKPQKKYRKYPFLPVKKRDTAAETQASITLEKNRQQLITWYQRAYDICLQLQTQYESHVVLHPHNSTTITYPADIYKPVSNTADISLELEFARNMHQNTTLQYYKPTPPEQSTSSGPAHTLSHP
jgi:hypothetical protein